MNSRYFILLMIIIPFLTGCWSHRELTDIAIVTAFGIDLEKDGHYMASFQVANPNNTAGGLQGGGTSTGSAVTIYTAHGENIVEVIKNASTKVSRILYFSHTNIVVIGEDLAKEEGIFNLLDFLDRDEEFRTTTQVVIAHNAKAADILKTATSIDKIPAKKVIQTLKNTSDISGEYATINIRQLINSFTQSGKYPVIPGFTIKGDKEISESIKNMDYTEPPGIITAEGMAMFKQGKLVDWVKGEEALGLIWALNKIKHTYVTIDWEEKKDAIVLRIMHDRTKVSTKMKGNKPIVTIQTTLKGDIAELNTEFAIKDLKTQRKIEQKVSRKVEEMIDKAVKKAQDNKVDVFGFGREIHQSHPKIWKKIQKEWQDEYFPHLELTVNAETIIRGSGLRNDPFLDNIDKF